MFHALEVRLEVSQRVMDESDMAPVIRTAETRRALYRLVCSVLVLPKSVKDFPPVKVLHSHFGALLGSRKMTEIDENERGAEET